MKTISAPLFSSGLKRDNLCHRYSTWNNVHCGVSLSEKIHDIVLLKGGHVYQDIHQSLRSFRSTESHITTKLAH